MPDGLPAMFQLAVPREMEERVNSRLRGLEGEGAKHPLLREDRASWNQKNRSLAEDAGSGSETAMKSLATLCGRDPRYLASELVVYAVLDAKLAIIHPSTRVPSEDRMPLSSTELAEQEEEQKRVRESVVNGKNFLEAMKHSIRRTTGRGLPDRYPQVLVADMLDAEEQRLTIAMEYVRTHRKDSPRAVSGVTGVSEYEAGRLLVSLRCWRELAARRVGKKFVTRNWENI